MKQRREKVLQNVKHRKIGKANAPVALQASIRANRASKDTQNITMTDNAIIGNGNTDNAIIGNGNTDNAITGEASTVHITLPPHSEPSIGDPLPDGQATVKASGHTLDLGDVGIYEFLIQGTPNPPDLEGIEEDQLLEIQ